MKELKTLYCGMAGCDEGFHTYCVTPRLHAVPDGDWYCSNCKASLFDRKLEQEQAKQMDAPSALVNTSQEVQERGRVEERAEEEDSSFRPTGSMDGGSSEQVATEEPIDVQEEEGAPGEEVGRKLQGGAENKVGGGQEGPADEQQRKDQLETRYGEVADESGEAASRLGEAPGGSGGALGQAFGQAHTSRLGPDAQALPKQVLPKQVLPKHVSYPKTAQGTRTYRAPAATSVAPPPTYRAIAGAHSVAAATAAEGKSASARWWDRHVVPAHVWSREAHTNIRTRDDDSCVEGDYDLDSFVIDGEDDDDAEEADGDSGVSSSHVCEVCASPREAEKMLLCDRCNDGYHLHCLSPPLPYIPAGDWFCNGCISAMRDVERTTTAAASLASTREGGEGHANVAYVQHSPYPGISAKQRSPVLTKRDFQDFFGPRFDQDVHMRPLGPSALTASAPRHDPMHAFGTAGSSRSSTHTHSSTLQQRNRHISSSFFNGSGQGGVSATGSKGERERVNAYQERGVRSGVWAAGSALERVAAAGSHHARQHLSQEHRHGLHTEHPGEMEVGEEVGIGEGGQAVEGDKTVEALDDLHQPHGVICPRCSQSVDSRYLCLCVSPGSIR